MFEMSKIVFSVAELARIAELAHENAKIARASSSLLTELAQLSSFLEK